MSSQMLRQLQARLVEREEAELYQKLMQAHHYLGAARKIGRTLWYVVTHLGEWVALLSFSAAALKTAARDQWIGWSYRQQYARLPLLANNTRFCVLPAWNIKNVASRALALCERRLSQDWRCAFGHSILLLETFVDQQHRGTLYLAANWQHIGETRGFRRIPGGYSAATQSPKKIFVRCLHPHARTLLSQSTLDTRYTGELEAPKLMLSMPQLRALPSIFQDVPDPRRVAGRRHTLSSVLSIAAGAYLCGARSWQGMGAWAERLTQSARQGIRCRCQRNHYLVPTSAVIRDVLMRVDRDRLQRALERWNARFGVEDASLILHARVLCLTDGQQRGTSTTAVTTASDTSCAQCGP
jgi:Domain of unknown function (DUF4338)/DDE_Tnp_1-associated